MLLTFSSSLIPSLGGPSSPNFLSLFVAHGLPLLQPRKLEQAKKVEKEARRRLHSLLLLLQPLMDLLLMLMSSTHSLKIPKLMPPLLKPSRLRVSKPKLLR